MSIQNAPGFSVQHVKLSGPMRGKPITDVPGISMRIAINFTQAQITHAEQLYAQCLSRGMDKKSCVSFIEGFDVESTNATEAYTALLEWYKSFQ